MQRRLLPVQPSNSAAGDHSRVSGPYSGLVTNYTARETDYDRCQYCKAEPVSVATDIAKARHEVLISVPGGKRCRRK